MQSFAVLNVAIITQLRGGSSKLGKWPLNSAAGHFWPVRERRYRTPVAVQATAGGRRPAATLNSGGQIARSKAPNRGGTRVLLSGRRRSAEKRGGRVPAGRGHGCRGRSVRPGPSRPVPDRCRSASCTGLGGSVWCCPEGRWQLPACGRARSVFEPPFNHGKSACASVQRPSCAIA